jgi:hypothetical protein
MKTCSFCKGRPLHNTGDSPSLAVILPPEMLCTNGTIAIIRMETPEPMGPDYLFYPKFCPLCGKRISQAT